MRVSERAAALNGEPEGRVREVAPVRATRRESRIATAKPPSYPGRVKRFHQTLGSLVSALLCLAALVMTATPVEAHTISHWRTPVTAGQHHHHHEDGSVTLEDHEREGHAAGDQGHDHMTTVAAVEMLPPVLAAAALVAVARSTTRPALGDSAPPGLRPPPDDRPPRTI